MPDLNCYEIISGKSWPAWTGLGIKQRCLAQSLPCCNWFVLLIVTPETGELLELEQRKQVVWIGWGILSGVICSLPEWSGQMVGHGYIVSMITTMDLVCPRLKLLEEVAGLIAEPYSSYFQAPGPNLSLSPWSYLRSGLCSTNLTQRAPSCGTALHKTIWEKRTIKLMCEERQTHACADRGFQHGTLAKHSYLS